MPGRYDKMEKYNKEIKINEYNERIGRIGLRNDKKGVGSIYISKIDDNNPQIHTMLKGMEISISHKIISGNIHGLRDISNVEIIQGKIHNHLSSDGGYKTRKIDLNIDGVFISLTLFQIP